MVKKKKRNPMRMPGKIVRMKLASLQVPPEYQRGVDPADVDPIKEEIEPNAIGVIKVAKRADGSMWVVDGWRRVCQLLDEGVEYWYCEVFESSGPEYEAGVFGKVSIDGRKPHTQHQKFKAQLTNKKPEAVAIHRVVTDVGLAIKPRRGGKTVWPDITCIATLYRHMRTHGEAKMAEAFRLLVATWPELNGTLDGRFIGAVVLLVARRGHLIRQDHWQKKMPLVKPAKLIDNLTVKQVEANVADALIRCYNKKLGAKHWLQSFAAEKEAEDEAKRRRAKLRGGVAEPPDAIEAPETPED